MIDFIFIGYVVTMLLLILGFIIKVKWLAMLASIGMVVVGVYSLINGIDAMTNLLVTGLSIIYTVVGLYIFLGSSLEDIQTY